MSPKGVQNPSFQTCYDPPSYEQENKNNPLSGHNDTGSKTPMPSEKDALLGGGKIPVVRAWTALCAFMMCYNTAFMALIPVTTQYLSQRIGQDEYNFTNFTHEIPCTKESNGSDAETSYEIQKKVSSLSLLLNYASSLPAIFTCLPYGTLSDHIGRKKVVLIPLVGALARTLGYVFVVKYRLDLNFLYFGSAIDGFCGSYHAVSMVTASLIADVTSSASNRAVSFAVIEFILITSTSLSSLTVGYLIEWDGYFYPTVIMSTLVFIAILIVIVYLPETLQVKAKPAKNPLTHLKRIIAFYILEGSVIRKALFKIGMLMFSLNILISIGRSTIETLYQLNHPFCWMPSKIGDFSAIQSFVQITCSIVSLKILRRWLELENIGMLALLCAIGGFVLEGFANSDWMLYLVPVMGLIMYSVTPITRALLSKMAQPEEQGALFASLSVMDAVCGILSFTFYSTIYIHTLDFYRGIVFFVMAGVCAVNFGLFLCFKKLRGIYEYKEIRHQRHKTTRNDEDSFTAVSANQQRLEGFCNGSKSYEDSMESV